jgi:MICOS complex subunit MIC60
VELKALYRGSGCNQCNSVCRYLHVLWWHWVYVHRACGGKTPNEFVNFGPGHSETTTVTTASPHLGRMFRALPVARQATPKGNSHIYRRVSTFYSFSKQANNSSQRLVTETTDSTPTKGKKRLIPRLIFYTTAATTTFYVGSAFVAFNNDAYHAFFQQRVPFAPNILQYGEDHGWDVITIADVIVNAYDGISGAYLYVRKQLGYSVEETPAKASSKEKEKPLKKDKVDETKGRVQKVVDELKTNVRVNTNNVHDHFGKAAAITTHQAIQFSQGVEELVLEAEAALQGKPFKKSPQPEAITTPDKPTPAALEASEPQGPNQMENVYDVPLPLGHEPPPGFVRPAPPKPPKPLAPGEPLPLVAPIVEELHSSEPILTHLASTIDSLASFLSANPEAANKARDVLDIAKHDLSGLAQSFERLHEEERAKLEQSLDEQTREYTLKLLELELQAQDKLELQETDFRTFYEEEKARFAQAYREKVEQELRTQSDIINERFVPPVKPVGHLPTDLLISSPA